MRGLSIVTMQIRLTPTQAQELQACPYSFQQKYLDKTVQLPPFSNGPAAQMGTNVHAALDVFYKRGGHTTQSCEDLLATFNYKWSSAGFTDEEQELAYRKQAGLLLRDYYQLSKNEPPSEKRLTERFQKTSKPLTLGKHQVSLSGRFDRLDLFADGTIEVVDYKTSDPASGGLPDEREMAEDLSNLIYYRLALEVYPLARSVTISRYYLRSKRKVSVLYTPIRLQTAKELLMELLDQLEEGIAPPSENFGCAWCLVRKVGKCPIFSEEFTNGTTSNKHQDIAYQEEEVAF